MKDKIFDAIIVGGSYAGLSAAMALGRSMRDVLIIDSGKPCNRQTPHAHNFITHDGETPAAIAAKAKQQVLAYPTVKLQEDFVTAIHKSSEHFSLLTKSGTAYQAKKVLLATGVKDLMPNIKGFADCWGISVLHCPYCHGYEVRETNLGVLGNGDLAFEMSKLIQHWSKDLTLFTNGASTLTVTQREALENKGIRVIEKEIAELVHKQGYLQQLIFQDGSSESLTALFAKIPFEHYSETIPSDCKLTEMGYIQVDPMQKTSLPGLYAAGDCTYPFRTLTMAVSSGTMAGAAMNKELIDESF
ncbi:MAG: pyridine nucleotide-disulfide oxidoreductase [Cytophagaceae bacterium]|jgi:thioredoxin reductase|nr:pyridine nucleotide-disulfide oxidoreductase [Cytophagaceae bacterium]